MLWSKAFIITQKKITEKAETVSHQLMLRAGLINMLAAGVYSYLPLGLKVLNNVEKIIREEMDATGAQEVFLPALQPMDLWKKTNRDEVMGDVMIKFTDRRGRNLCLGPTHEEVVTDLAKSFITSYKQLPFTLYQIQSKFRDEIRPRSGLVRSCEFIMKDAYSFDRDEIELSKDYEVMHSAYCNIFKRCGLNFISVEADSGIMGGDISHEFMVPAGSGEDSVLVCDKCDYSRTNPVHKVNEARSCPHCNNKLVEKNAIEVGHIFKLGTKYSQALGCEFVDEKGMKKPVIMGCYGIGVSRLLPAIIEQNHDEDGVIWPKEVSPYDVVVSVVNADLKPAMKLANDLNNVLEKEGISVLLDDRSERAGVKFKDADLIGIPLRIVIGENAIKSKKFELILRHNKETEILEQKHLIKAIKDFKDK